uniref:Uncharacterized protein n=1 Tax=Arundo donax TaxID=35708 RepID=A0A0A9BHV7_ARUDO
MSNAVDLRKGTQ